MRLDAGVVRRCEVVALEDGDVVLGTSDREGDGARLERATALERRAREDDEPAARRRAGRASRAVCLGGREDEALLRRGAKVSRGGADDPPDEEVEQDEEEGLECEEDRLQNPYLVRRSAGARAT